MLYQLSYRGTAKERGAAGAEQAACGGRPGSCSRSARAPATCIQSAPPHKRFRHGVECPIHAGARVPTAKERGLPAQSKLSAVAVQAPAPALLGPLPPVSRAPHLTNVLGMVWNVPFMQAPASQRRRSGGLRRLDLLVLLTLFYEPPPSYPKALGIIVHLHRPLYALAFQPQHHLLLPRNRLLLYR